MGTHHNPSSTGHKPEGSSWTFPSYSTSISPPHHLPGKVWTLKHDEHWPPCCSSHHLYNSTCGFPSCEVPLKNCNVLAGCCMPPSIHLPMSLLSSPFPVHSIPLIPNVHMVRNCSSLKMKCMARSLYEALPDTAARETEEKNTANIDIVLTPSQVLSWVLCMWCTHLVLQQSHILSTIIIPSFTGKETETQRT